MLTQATGFEKVKKYADDIRRRKVIYCIFTIDPVDPVGFKILHVVENNLQVSAKDIISKENLEKTFEECKSKITDGSGYFIAYDFGYFGPENDFRNLLCLFSFIPDSLKVKSKVVFSKSSLELAELLGMAKHLPVKSTADLDYKEIRQMCTMHKRN